MSLMHRLWWLVVALMLSLLGLGCGAGPRLHPVNGSVLFENTPPEGATVIFQPVNGEVGAISPSGTVQADGRFSLSTHKLGTGAPEGEYRVVITWFPPKARESFSPKNKLPLIYGDVSKTPLPPVSVQAGTNQLEPFVLKSK